ncbi:MAG: glycosyltransferase family 4 protein [Acidimicrobiales bacterium]
MSARPLLVGLGWLDAPGGLERYLADLREGLDRPPAVVLSDLAEPPVGVTVAARPSDPLPRRLLGVRRAVLAQAPAADLLDLHFSLTGLAARSSRAARRLPFVTHFQGPWADESTAHRWVKRRVERLAHRGSQHFVVLSGSMGRTLIERYGASPWRVSIVPPGVDLSRFTPGAVTAARERLGLDVAPDAFLAVAVRRLVPRTGIDVLLDAWAAARQLPSGATLLVAGDGPEAEALRTQLQRLAPERRVELLGPVDEATLVDLYRAADVAVVPSVRLEGFGLVALEALACGTPVVVTDCGGLPEAVTGLAVPVVAAGERGALTAALEDATRGHLPSGERCRAHAERFAWPSVVARHQVIYDDAAARRLPSERRVVVLDHSAARSGGEIAMARLVEASPTTRFHAVLFEAGPFERLLAAGGATTEVRQLGPAGRVDRAAVARPATVARHGLRTAAFTLGLAARLRRLRPDVVHANSLKAGIVGGLACRLAGIPMVWHVRDRLADDYLPGRSARLVRLAVRRLPVAVVAPSQAVLDTLGPAPDPARQERIVVADPHPPIAAPAVRSGAGPVVVAMVGRLAPWKGQDVFLRAFASAFGGGSEQALLVGAALFGDEQRFAAELDALVDELHLRPQVSLLGERSDVPDLLAGADIVVHASTVAEPFGQVVVEGMLAGAAVVATAGGGPSELVRPEIDGLLVPPGDVAAMAAALARLAADPEERLRLGRSARERAAEITEPDHIAATVADLHARAAGRPRRGRASVPRR